MDRIIEALKTFKGQLVTAAIALIVAVLGAVETGIIDLSDIAAAFIGDKADQVQGSQDD